MKKIPFIVLLAFLVGCSGTPEPKPFTSTIDKYAYVKEYMSWYIKKQMQEKDIVGLSVALVDDQKIVWSQGFGYCDKAKGIKAFPKTRYRAGSITKLFTSMATMKLAEDGKVDIDKPFKRYLPEFSIKSRFGSTDGITPRNIMTHHSGLPSEWVEKMFATNPLPYTEHVNLIHNEYVAYKPNTIMSYSNLAVTLLGHSIKKVSGMKYAEYVKVKLLEPMGMYNADLKMALNGNNASKSYTDSKEINEYAIGEIPAGALNISVVELSHLAMMINANGMYNNRRVLKSSTLKEMFSVQNKDVALDVGEEIGLGYFIDNTLLGEQDTSYHHGGNTMAHNAYFIVSPHSKLGVIVMSNTSGTKSTEIARKILEKAWEVKTGKKIKEENLIIQHDSSFKGIYVTALGKVSIKKDSDDSYVAQVEDETFKIYRTKNNTYKIKYKLLSLFPIGDDELDKVELYTDDINGHHVIVASMEGQKFIGGVKVEKPTDISKIWKSYLGHYEVLNNQEPKDWKITDIEFLLEDGFFIAKTKYISGEKITMVLKPINETEAIIEGLGRSRQETIYYKDGMFHAQGLRFRKEK